MGWHRAIRWVYRRTDGLRRRVSRSWSSRSDLCIEEMEHRLLLSAQTVSNLTLTLSAVSISEGGTVALGGMFADPGTLDTHTVMIDWGDGSAPTTVNLTAGQQSFSGASHQYLDNPAGNPTGSYTITTTVTDSSGGQASATAPIQVVNVAPSALRVPLSTTPPPSPPASSVTVSVTAWGATGNGITDDTAAITNAIAAAGVGGTVLFPAGTYLISSSISPLASQTFQGAGGTFSTIAQRADFLTSNGLIYVQGVSGARILDLAFTGNAANRQPSIFTSAAPGTDVERCTSDATTQRLVIFTNGSNQSRVAYCTVNGTTGSNAIEFNGSDNCTALLNTIRNPQYNGIEVYQHVAGTPIVGSRVIGNLIVGAGHSGIDVLGDNGSVVMDNLILNSASVGFIALPGEIDPSVPSTNGTFANNAVQNCGGTSLPGVMLASAASGWTIANDTVTGSGTFGIAVYGPNATLEGDTVRLNRYHGIYVQGPGATVAGNTCNNNSVIEAGSFDGIRIGGNGATVVGNTCTDTRTPKLQANGVLILSGCTGTTVWGNTLSGNLYAGLVDLGTGTSYPSGPLAVPSYAPMTISAGGSVELGVGLDDPGVLDTHTVTVDWVDGTAATTVPLSAGVLACDAGVHQYLASLDSHGGETD